MERYQVADGPNGPWIELLVANSPQAALDKARASFGWPTVWVAKMRPLTGQDILPTREVLWSEIMERVQVLFGSSAVDQLNDEMNASQLHDALCNEATAHLLDVQSEVLVPDIMHAYRANENARLVHFVRGATKPTLKELLS